MSLLLDLVYVVKNDLCLDYARTIAVLILITDCIELGLHEGFICVLVVYEPNIWLLDEVNEVSRVDSLDCFHLDQLFVTGRCLDHSFLKVNLNLEFLFDPTA